MLKRLDLLYTKVGMAAAELAVPQSLVRSKQAALSAAAELASAREKLDEAELARQEASSGPGAIQLEAGLSRAKTELQQVQVRSDFAHLVLGRESVAAGFDAAGLEDRIEEIRQLQHCLDGLR